MDFLAIKQPLRLLLTRNPIVVILDPVTLPLDASRTDLRYFIELKVQSSFQNSAFIGLPIQEASEKPIPANYTSSPGAFFEIQTRLDDQMKATVPVYSDRDFSVCPDLTRQYYYVAERYNDEELIDSQQSNTTWAFRGAISMRHYSMYKDTFFTDVVGTEGRFLTWQPDGKMVREDQPERLYFLTNFTPNPLKLFLRVRLSYSDGTRETKTLLQADNITAMTVYSVPAGYNELGLGTSPKTVISYEVWLSNEKLERVSEMRTYRVDRQSFESVRYILFQNSLGGYDTIRCVGSPTESVAVQRQIVERFTDYDYLPTVSDVLINSVTGQRQIRVNLGNWLNEAYREYLEDLLLSEEFYIVDDQEFIPIVPGFSELITQSVTEWPIERILPFTMANPTGGYSRLPKVETTSRPTGWRQYSTSCELDGNGVRTGKKIVNEIVKYYLDTGENLRPLVTKSNIPGAEGYVEPWASADCLGTTTPYLNALIQRKSVLKKNNCGSGNIGTNWTIKINAGAFGSEISQADANHKASVALDALDTQANANLKGLCVVASPIRIGLINKVADVGDGKYLPVPSVYLNNVGIIPNHITVDVVRYATDTYPSGTYTIDVRIEFTSAPTTPYRVRIVDKNLTSPTLNGLQTYRFANIQVDSGDGDLIISVERIV